MKIPMPSPNGTNRANLFISTAAFPCAGAAYDAKPKAGLYGLRGLAKDVDPSAEDPTDQAQQAFVSTMDMLHRFLKGAVEPSDFVECERLMGNALTAHAECIEQHKEALNEAQSKLDVEAVAARPDRNGTLTVDKLPVQLRQQVARAISATETHRQTEFEKRYPAARRIGQA